MCRSYSLAKAKDQFMLIIPSLLMTCIIQKRSEKRLKNLFLKLPNITSQLVTKDYKQLLFTSTLIPHQQSRKTTSYCQGNKSNNSEQL